MSIRSIPGAVRNHAIAGGHQGRLEQLPALVGELEREWSITVGRSYHGGNEAFVADASLDDGSGAVLKVFIPRDDDSARNEITVLRLADGDGCARLLRFDLSRSAMLIERLGAFALTWRSPSALRRSRSGRAPAWARARAAATARCSEEVSASAGLSRPPI